MLGGGVLGLVFGHADEAQLDLQRRGADEAGKLVLGLDLLRHQVQQADLHRPDVLPDRRLLGHDHDALAVQDVDGGQSGGDLDGEVADDLEWDGARLFAF